MKTGIDLYKESTAIRNTYKILPFQGVWSWLTGKDIPGRKALWKSSSIEMICWSISWIVVGTLLIYLSLNSNMSSIIKFILYLVGVLFSTSGARYIVATIIHQGVHGNLLSTKSRNRVICEILSTIFITQPYDSYRQFHIYEHHGKDFSTTEDKDLAAVYKLGFEPGKTKKQLYINLFLTLFSPYFHFSYFYGRIKSNLIGVPVYRFIMTIVYFLFLGYLAWWMGMMNFVLFIIIPYIIVYQIASLLQLMTEHVWLLRRENETILHSHIKNSLGRFCGSPCPESFSLKYSLQWIIWAFKHLFYHLPVRMLIVQGSLICHDWHHRVSNIKEWYDYTRLREINAEKLAKEGKYDYTEFWGFYNCLDHVLTMLSNSEPIDVNNLKYRLN
ncbi:fatty acid desaturase [Xenorhabdus sp. SGI246]|uniref:fatty acid desaturase n=1 Tax=Xenorhabdus sp. SGI246 TaxID=3158263 RepID=UPI00349F7EA7